MSVSLTESIGDVLARCVRATLRFRRLTIGATLLAAAAGAYYAAHNLGVNTDTTNMISAELPWRQHFIEYREAFPARDRNLLIVIDARSARQADEFSTALLAELRASPDLYRDVFAPGEGEFFARNGLLYSSADDLATFSDRLAAAQPLFGLLKSGLNGAAVIDVVNRTLEQSDGSVASPAVVAPLYAELGRTLNAAADGAAEPLSWSALLGGAAPSTRRIVMLQPKLDFDRLQPASAAMAGVREIVARLNSSEAAPVTVRLTGTVAMEHEELVSVSQGAGIAALATLVMVALVLYAALRSWRLLLISIVTLVAGLSLTAAFAAAAVGHLNLISIAFVVLNVGLGSDYVIHVCLRQKELMAAGVPIEDALVATMRGVGASLVLCAVTTAAGFYAFIPTTFEGVSELGLIAGTGVFIGVFVSVTLLPALIAELVKAQPSRAGRTWINPGVFAPLVRRPRVVLGATVAVGLVTFAALPRVAFDSNPIHLRDPRSESVQALSDLAAAGEAPLLNLVAIAPDHATAQRWSSELERLPTVQSVIGVASLVPRDQAAKVAMLEDLDLILGPDFATLPEAPPDAARLARELDALRITLTARQADSERELLQAVERFAAALDALRPDAESASLGDLDRALTADLPRELQRLADALAAEPFGREALPRALLDRWVAEERELIEIVPAENVNDNDAAARFVDSVHSVVETATGLPVVYREASQTVVRAFGLALLYALVMVTAIIWLFLRDPRDVLLVIVPILLAAGVTAGVTGLIEMPLNYANVIALPLLLGIGVDNGIHIVHRLRSEPADVELFDTSTLRAVLASGLTTVASFGNLGFSAHVGTASMGKLLALGLGVSMAATLIVLPAWLRVFGSHSRARETAGVA